MSGGMQRAPRRDGGAFIALRALHAMEGQAELAQWHQSALKSLGTKARGEQWDVIVQALINSGMVFRRGDMFIVSDDGKVLLGEVSEIVPRAEPEAVPARYVPPMRPLSSKHLVNVRSMREGAFDYRDIPSLHGDQRLAFQTSLHVAGGDAKA